LEGCTVLHYCFEYKHTELGKYLRDKGADDSLLNAEGFTCYEGINAAKVNDI
jgi:ankyrin repeat protein